VDSRAFLRVVVNGAPPEGASSPRWPEVVLGGSDVCGPFMVLSALAGVCLTFTFGRTFSILVVVWFVGGC